VNQIKFLSIFLLSTFLLSSYSYANTSLKGEIIPYHWTGLYAGLNVGLVNHTMNITDVNATSFLGTIQETSNFNWTGGFQIGLRQQLDLFARTSGVYGIEFSTNFSDARFNETYGSSFATYELDSNNRLKTICLLQGMGGVASDRTLLFLAAGLSWTQLTGETTNLDSIAFFNGFGLAKNVFGSALSAGIEYAFTDKFSARFKVDMITPKSYSKLDNTDDIFDVTNNIAQGVIAINYKFI